MSLLTHKLVELSQEKQTILETERQLKLQRRHEIGLLAEQYGILNLPDEVLCRAFSELAVSYQARQVQHV